MAKGVNKRGIILGFLTTLLISCGQETPSLQKWVSTQIPSSAASLGRCTGTPSSCNLVLIENCTRQLGCSIAWRARHPYCTGTAIPCDEIDEMARCEAQQGCHWSLKSKQQVMK